MKTRIYDEKVDLSSNSIKDFWSKRAITATGVKTVLLGDDKGVQDFRNERETKILTDAVSGLKTLKILDIGCGIGRWAENLYDKIETYTGIDFTSEYVRIANDKFSNDSNIRFYEMSVCEMAPDILDGDYNLVICTGVLTYINDNNLQQIFTNIKQMNPNVFYLQESVSIMSGRLTLNNFESKELKTNYSAIYRTQNEYEQYLNEFEILKTDLLLDDKTGARQETNARYWVMK